MLFDLILLKRKAALTGVAQWVECHPTKRNQFDSRSGHMLRWVRPLVGACVRDNW